MLSTWDNEDPEIDPHQEPTNFQKEISTLKFCKSRASCIEVFSEALRSFMRIRFDCQYAARLEVCVLKFLGPYQPRALPRPSRRLLHPHNSDERLHIETVRRQPRCT